MPTTTLLAAALAAAARGWPVFPLRPDDRPGDPDRAKRPAFPDRCTADRCDRADPRCRAAGRHIGWEDRATTDPARITRAWSTRPYGVGIACGPAGLLVVDLDTPKPGQTSPPEWELSGNGVAVFAALAHRHTGDARPAFDTHTVTTGRGGRHLYYQHPAGPPLRNTSRALGWLVDTRAHGGYVVAAGTTVNGRPYTVAVDIDPAPTPGWLAGLLRPTASAPAGPVRLTLPAGRSGAYLAAAIRHQVDHVQTAAEGARNRALFISAAALGQLVAGGALTDTDVYAVLEPAAARVGLPVGETRRTIASGLRTGARRPRSVAV